MFTTSGYTFSVITPRWVVIYSSISCNVWALICLPLSSALASLKSKSTRHWCSFLMKRMGRSLGGVSKLRVSLVLSEACSRLTHEWSESLDFDLFSYNKATAPLFSWRFSYHRNRVLWTGSESIKSSVAGRSDRSIKIGAYNLFTRVVRTDNYDWGRERRIA